MPRRARRSVGGVVYHVLNRSNGRRRIFLADGDYAAFSRALAEACRLVPGVRLLAWCVMPNHWHLVLWPKADGQLSQFFESSQAPLVQKPFDPVHVERLIAKVAAQR